MNFALQALEDCDVDLFRRANHMASHDDAEICLHMCRTIAESVSPEKRIYSHNWLTERGIESGLPDQMRPAPQRVEPKIVSAVGISVNFHHDWELGKHAEGQMSEKVAQMYADGDHDPALVSREITAIREKIIGV